MSHRRDEAEQGAPATYTVVSSYHCYWPEWARTVPALVAPEPLLPPPPAVDPPRQGRAEPRIKVPGVKTRKIIELMARASCCDEGELKSYGPVKKWLFRGCLHCGGDLYCEGTREPKCLQCSREA